MSESAEKPAIVLSAAEIQKIIPHRWPFLLVDRVVELDEDRGYVKARRA